MASIYKFSIIILLVLYFTSLGGSVTQKSSRINDDKENIEAFLRFSTLLESENEGSESGSGSGDEDSDSSEYNVNGTFLVMPDEAENLMQSTKKISPIAANVSSRNQLNNTLNTSNNLKASTEKNLANALNYMKEGKYLYNFPDYTKAVQTAYHLSAYPTTNILKTNSSNLQVTNVTYQKFNDGKSKPGIVKYKHKLNKNSKASGNNRKNTKQQHKTSNHYTVVGSNSSRKLENSNSTGIGTGSSNKKSSEERSPTQMTNNTILSDKPKERQNNNTKESKGISSLGIVDAQNLTAGNKNIKVGSRFEESEEDRVKKTKEQNDDAKTLNSLLTKLKFNNGASGKVKSGQEFAYISQCGLYTEPQNVSFVEHSWVTKTYSPYFYLYEKPKKYEKCKPSAWMNGTDMRGSVFLSFEVKSLHGSTMENNAKICEKYCCKEPRCAAWVLRLQSEGTSNCPQNSYCCWLKTDIPKPEPHDECVSGIVHRDHYKHPPAGMRSAVPLGALGTGSFEMRADGTFHEWTIENQSPGGSAKLSKTSLEMMLLGVRVKKGSSKPRAAVLRTHAPRGFENVESMTYSGSFPISKLKVDLHKSLRKEVDLNLYAYSAFHPRGPKESATPAVIFSLDVTNPSNEEIDVSFMMNLPFGYNDDTIRRGNNFAEIAFTRLVTAADCQNACAKKSKCMAWTTNGPFSCMLKDGMPLHAYEYGIISGLKGEWSVKQKGLNCKRPGFYAQSGDITLRPVDSGSEVTSFTVEDDPEVVWDIFKKTGYVTNTTGVNVTGLNGAVSTSTKLKPKESKVLSIVFSWYFPNKGIADERVGNFYNNLFKSSTDVAKHSELDMNGIILDVVNWQSSIIPPIPKSNEKENKQAKKKSKAKHLTCNATIGGINTLPECLQDILLNSLSSLRSGMWMENGRWRQWEAFDCANMDPVHVDFHRIIPYVIMFPEIAKQVMLAWADHQQVNGMIQESLSMGCLEETSKEGVAGGRLMADVNVGFIVQAYLIYSWTNDTSFFEEIYPFTVRAMEWLITESTKGTGLPYRKPDTYDLFELEKYDHCAYNSILYILALHTMKIMSKLQKDKSTYNDVTSALDRADKQFDVEMWDEKRGFYHAWFDDEWGSPSWLMSDVFYGQVWSYTLGLGDLVDKQKLRRHLKKEGTRNDSPFGLKVVSKSDSIVPLEDTSVILGDELNSCKSLENITKTESIWMTSSSDWSTLQLHLGENPYSALQQAAKSLDNYRSTLRDQWNFHGLTSSEHYGLDGLPWATSHYTFHLVLWHLPLALSGQRYYAPNGSLTFVPKFETPYWLPFYTPFCMGNIEAKEVTTETNSTEVLYALKVSSGTCNLKELSIAGSKYGKNQITIDQGEKVEWSAPKRTKKDIVKAMLDQLKH